jgi:hypothetical protein
LRLILLTFNLDNAVGRARRENRNVVSVVADIVERINRKREEVLLVGGIRGEFIVKFLLLFIRQRKISNRL